MPTIEFRQPLIASLRHCPPKTDGIQRVITLTRRASKPKGSGSGGILEGLSMTLDPSWGSKGCSTLPDQARQRMKRRGGPEPRLRWRSYRARPTWF
jgi:hypothetical protein